MQHLMHQLASSGQRMKLFRQLPHCFLKTGSLACIAHLLADVTLLQFAGYVLVLFEIET